MLGFHISVYRQADGGAQPATFQAGEGVRLAVWQSDTGGLGWLDALVKRGHAVDLGGNGYPFRYTALAAHLLPQLLDGPPLAREHWHSAPGDIVTNAWKGRTTVDQATVDACRPDEWLLVEAWDES